MSSVIPPVFSGLSSYASDLQKVISRAVGIANLPIRQLEQQLGELNAQTTALSGLDSVFDKLQTAIKNLDSSIGAQSYVATSSDPESVSASVAAGALEGSYTIEVTSVGAYSTSISNSALLTVSDPLSTSISASTEFTLTVNGTDFTITPDDGSLLGLARAINAAATGVHASLVNVGPTGSPEYRLVLRSDTLGADTIQLNDGSQDLLDSMSTGSEATYLVNGLATPIQSTSRTVTLAPGVTIDLLQETTGQPVTVTVSRDTVNAATALSEFVSAFNSTVAALDLHVGQDAGSLSGQSIVRDLRSALRQITQFEPSSGSITSLARLGIELDRNGLLTFDPTTFNADSVDEIQTFLGSVAGGGFLKLANDTLETANSGSLQSAIELVNKQITEQNKEIAERQERLATLQDNLTQRMAAADALIAQLESQKSFITNLFTAQLNYNLNGAGVSSD